MLAIERRHYILNHLQENKRVLVSDLAVEFNVSEETIRRDLDKLEQEGVVVKTYGGAFIKDDSNIDLPASVRKKKNVAQKQAIAELVANMVKDGDSVFLDESSTALFIAKRLKVRKNLTLITNSVEVLVELADVSGWRIMSTGGDLKEGSFALVGSRAERFARDFHVDKMFFSCKGVDSEFGITDTVESDAGIKRAMASSAKRVYLAVDSSKFGRVSFARIVDFSDLDGLISEERPIQTVEDACIQNNVEMIYPEAQND